MRDTAFRKVPALQYEADQQRLKELEAKVNRYEELVGSLQSNELPKLQELNAMYDTLQQVHKDYLTESKETHKAYAKILSELEGLKGRQCIDGDEIHSILSTHRDQGATKFHCTKHPECGCGVNHCKDDQGEQVCDICGHSSVHGEPADMNMEQFNTWQDCPNCNQPKSE